MELTQEIVRRLLRYEPETGKLFWLPREEVWFRNTKYRDALGCANNWNAKNAGREAFSAIGPNGYKTGAIFKKLYYAHRIIFLWMEGILPEQVDHKNRNRADNRWENLINSNSSSNSKNRGMYSRNTSGFNGVCPIKGTSSWAAYIKSDGVLLRENFKSKEEAIRWRQEMNEKFKFVGGE